MLYFSLPLVTYEYETASFVSLNLRLDESHWLYVLLCNIESTSCCVALNTADDRWWWLWEHDLETAHAQHMHLESDEGRDAVKEYLEGVNHNLGVPTLTPRTMALESDNPGNELAAFLTDITDKTPPTSPPIVPLEGEDGERQQKLDEFNDGVSMKSLLQDGSGWGNEEKTPQSPPVVPVEDVTVVTPRSRNAAELDAFLGNDSPTDQLAAFFNDASTAGANGALDKTRVESKTDETGTGSPDQWDIDGLDIHALASKYGL